MLMLLTASYATAATPDSLRRPSAKQIVAEMSQLIRQYAVWSSSSLTKSIRYDARIDTTAGLKLYIGRREQPADERWGDPEPNWFGRDKPQWYCIDFEQAIYPHELSIYPDRNGTFRLLVEPRISRQVRTQRTRPLTVYFSPKRTQRTAAYQQVQARLTYLLDQLLVGRFDAYVQE
jgi:hypothetical protein